MRMHRSLKCAAEVRGGREEGVRRRPHELGGLGKRLCARLSTTSWNTATWSLHSSFTSRRLSAPTCRKCSKSTGKLISNFRRPAMMECGGRALWLEGKGLGVGGALFHVTAAVAASVSVKSHVLRHHTP